MEYKTSKHKLNTVYNDMYTIQFGRAFNNNLNTLIKIIINMQWEYNQPHEMYFHHNYVCVWVCVCIYVDGIIIKDNSWHNENHFILCYFN